MRPRTGAQLRADRTRLTRQIDSLKASAATATMDASIELVKAAAGGSFAARRELAALVESNPRAFPAGLADSLATPGNPAQVQAILVSLAHDHELKQTGAGQMLFYHLAR